MTSSTFSRAKFGGALVIAFLSGLIFASSFDLTQASFAQQARPVNRTVETPATPAATATMADLSSAFTSIAERVTPAVVSIQAERSQSESREQQRRPNRQPSIEDFLRQFGDPQQVQPRQASGTGFIVRPDGYILTNNHVVAGFDRVQVTLTDRRTFPARVVGRDETTDVAVVKIDAKNLPTVPLGDDNEARIGEWVVAIGNPLGLDFTVTSGIISAKGRGSQDVRVNSNQWAITDFIQTDAAINPGNSGGPLVNIRGEVIGINTAIASQTGFYAGYGFAIPVTLAKEVMEDIIEHGRVRRAMLGIQIRDITAEDAAVAGLDKIAGVLVQPYSPENQNGPAARAGIEAGDVIVKADGREADRVSTLQRIIRSHEPGQTVTIEAMRYGQRKTFSVRLAEVPADSGARVVAANEREGGSDESSASRKLGITVEPITDEVLRQRGIGRDAPRGLLVVDVDPDGPSRGRLGPGDMIIGVLSPGPRRDIRAASDLQAVLARVSNGGYVSLTVYNVEVRQTRIVNLRVGD